MLGHPKLTSFGGCSQAFTPIVFGDDRQTYVVDQVDAGPTVEDPVVLMELTTAFNREGEVSTCSLLLCPRTPRPDVYKFSVSVARALIAFINVKPSP